MELAESTFLTSDYTTKLQSSKQYGTGTKQTHRPMEQDRKMQILHTFLVVLGPRDPVLGPSMILPMGPRNSDQELLVKRNGLRVLVQ